MLYLLIILIVFFAFIPIRLLRHNQRLRQQHRVEYDALCKTLDDLNEKHITLLEKTKLIAGFCNTYEKDIKAIISEMFKLQKICIELQNKK